MPFLMSIQFDQSPVQAILSKLANFDAVKADLFDELGQAMAESTRMRFIDGVDVSGNPWKVSWRARMQGRDGVGVGKTLRDTGRLMNSYTHNVLADGVEWGTGVEYAAPLHYGATILPKNGQYITFAVGGQFRKVKKAVLPAREQLGVSADDEEMTLDITGSFIDDYVLRGS